MAVPLDESEPEAELALALEAAASFFVSFVSLGSFVSLAPSPAGLAADDPDRLSVL